MRRFVVGLLIVVSAVSLLLASTSLWTRRHVVNTQVFVTETQEILAAPAVQQRIADQVTTTVMTNPDVKDAVDEAVAALPPRLQQFRPAVADGIRSLVATGVRRLLSSDAFTGVTSAALTSAHTQLVNGQPVEFTLGMAKDLVPADRRDGLAGQVLGLVPDDVGVTLVTPTDAPRLYSAIDLLKSVWWWLGLLALGTLAGALGVSRRRRGTLRAWSVTTAVLGVLLLIALRVVRGPLLTAARPDNRAALAAVWDIFAGSLRIWTVWLVVGALVITVLTLVWGRLGIVAGVRRGVRAAREQVRQRHEARAVAAAAGTAEQAGQPAGSAPPQEPWTRRVAAGTEAFVEGMELDRRVAGLSGFVRARLRTARWAGIAAGAVVLLLWPAPTLSVLIWIAALVALYLGLLEWLVARAPEPAAVGATAEVPSPRAEVLAPTAAMVGAGGLARPARATVPDGAHEGAGPPTVPSARTSTDGPPAPPERPTPLTAEQLSGLGGRLDLLVRLGEARDAGVLTEAEFAQQKDQLLAL